MMIILKYANTIVGGGGGVSASPTNWQCNVWITPLATDNIAILSELQVKGSVGNNGFAPLCLGFISVIIAKTQNILKQFLLGWNKYR
jgi:hypothetical protein